MPCRCSSTKPADFKTWRCCDTAGRLTGRWLASSPTVDGRRRSRWTTLCRVGSESAPSISRWSAIPYRKSWLTESQGGAVALPPDVQRDAKRAYRIFQINPNHPGLQSKTLEGEDHILGANRSGVPCLGGCGGRPRCLVLDRQSRRLRPAGLAISHSNGAPVGDLQNVLAIAGHRGRTSRHNPNCGLAHIVLNSSMDL